MKFTGSILVFLLAILFSYSLHSSDLTWSELMEKKEGTITIYYTGTELFLIENEDGSLKGMEYEMMVGFKHFLLKKYGITLNLEWISKESFKYVFEMIKHEPGSGDIGLDIISKIQDREEEIDFSNPYFPDIQVLISNNSIPTVNNLVDFKNEFDNYTAISVASTTSATELQNIKNSHDLSFEIKYMKTSNDILDGIINEPLGFGYMNLPNYLIALNESKNIKRQHVLPIRGLGYCVTFKKGSDWSTPINEYLASVDYEILKKKGIQKYLGSDVYKLIESISNGEDEEMILLIKEKELIERELLEREKQVQLQSYITNMLLACVVLVLTVVFALFNRNRIKSRANVILTRHRNLIEEKNILLSKRNNELLELDEEKNNFINILSHDLRAPINNIKGLAGVLKMDANLSESQLKMTEHISTESERLNKMITRILDVERIESSSTDDFRKTELEVVLNKVLTNYKQQANDKKITLTLHNLPNQFVMGLEQYLFHVFENLLSNAIKFSPLGEAVCIQIETVDGHHLVNIADRGLGLSKEDQKIMFKKFQRLSAKPTAGERSTGLGLSIVAKYTKLLGGELQCKSAPDQGTTFIVKLKAI